MKKMWLLPCLLSLQLYTMNDEHALLIQTNYGSINKDEPALQDQLSNEVTISVEHPLQHQSVWEDRKQRLKQNALKIAAWGGGGAVCIGFGSYNAQQLINYAADLTGLAPTIIWFSSSIVFSIKTGLTLYEVWHEPAAQE